MNPFYTPMRAIGLHAWVSSDAYHVKPKGDGATIMVSGVSVACHGWMGLEVILSPTVMAHAWKHDNIMSNVNKIIDESERLYPWCQLLLTYDNAPCHVAKMKGSLSTAAMCVSDGGKQPILTQNGRYDAVIQSPEL